MSEKFRRIKKRKFILSIAESLLFALSAALFCTGAVMLILKLCAVSAHFGWYILTSVFPAAAAGTVTFLLIRPTDAKVAAELDRYYSMRERISTMVEYDGREGDIVEIQRADAVERLDAAPRQKPALRRVLALVLVPVVALGLFVSALAVSDSAEEPEPEGFIYTSSQKSALRQLVIDVGNSYLDEELSSGIAVMLESLSDTLDTVEYLTEMQNVVLMTVSLIDAAVVKAVTFDEIASGLEEDNYLLSLASAIRKGVSVYREDDTVLNTLDSVNNRRTLLDNNDGVLQAAEEYLDALTETFTVTEDSDQAALSSYTSYYCTQLSYVLSSAVSTSVSESDELCTVLSSFCSDLLSANAHVNTTYSDDTVNAEFSSVLTSFVGDFPSALRDQVYTCMMDEFVRNRLAEIFGVTLPDSGIDTSVRESESSDPSGGESGGGSGNASGTGDKLYGSDDEIYDPEEQAYAEYGPLLDSYYYSVVLSKLEEEDISDELIQFINNYFNYLSAGFSD